MSRVMDLLLDRQQEMIDTLERLVMQDSPTSDPAAVNALADLLADLFASWDAHVERLPQTRYGDHLRVAWGEGSRQVLLLGHMDTVWPVGESQRRPFQLDRDKATGSLTGTGPGIFDMKGGLVIGLYAFAAIRELGLSPAHRLVFLFNSDEEEGSNTSRRFVEDEARKSDAVLVLEPSREEALVTWRKGVGSFELEVQGVASHAGAAHPQGVSAVEELAHQILVLEEMTDYERGSTVNVGVITGGSRSNVRPALATAAVDLRVSSAAESQRMTAAIMGLSPVNPKATVRVSGGMNRPPWEASTGGSALFERARQVGAGLGLDLWPAGTGGGSDGNFTAALGIPTLDGLGIVGDAAHSLAEWADLSSMPPRAALLAQLILDLDR